MKVTLEPRESGDSNES